MTGKGHHISGVICSVGFAQLAYDMGLSFVVVGLGVILGSKAPDWMEILIKGKRLITHRTITHWLPLWVAALYFSYEYVDLINSYAMHLGELIIGFSIGGLLHLLLDIPNPMGIPILTPTRRFSLNLWNSGSNEFVIHILLAMGTIYYIYPTLF
jgi:membrane-bound metal-dependent hydrolase YbcI (DUF457 family)